MSSTDKIDRNFSEEILEPTILVLSSQSVVAESAASKPLYQIDRSVTSIPQKNSSVIFERVEHGESPTTEYLEASTKQENRHLFYLAHPVDAQYRNDIPGYYITSVAPDMLGNICFETSKSRFQKTEFEALLNAGKSWRDTPPFDNNATQQALFSVKPNWNGSRYTWSNADGTQIAHENGKGNRHKLVITEPMQRNIRDALVAMWILKSWHDTAESKEAKREALDRMTPPQVYQSNSKLAKRAGALGGLAAAGGGGGC